MRTFEAFAANDRGIGHDFWLFHGVNYLSNNPFPGIYRGDRVYRGRLFSHIMEKHLDTEGFLSERGRQCLVWASTLPDELFRASAYVKAFSRKYGSDPLSPNDPYVETAVLAMARVMESATKGWGKTEPPAPREYYRDPVRYGREMGRVRRAVLECDPRNRGGWEFWVDVHKYALAQYGLPPGVAPFRLEYRERNDRGYLRNTGRIEEKRKASVSRKQEG
jgi:hypothetical protein